MEIWKQILKPDGSPYKSNFVEGYFVSSLGRVKTLRNTGNEKILSPWANRYGYLLVTICDNEKKLKKRVNRLVMEAFVGDIPEGLQVDHINRVKSDNRLENLRFATPKENSRNRGEYDQSKPWLRIPVRCIETGEEFKSGKSAGEKIGARASGIFKSCKKGYACRGLHFEIINH